MTYDREDEWDSEWRDRLQSLSRGLQPPDWLEERVVDSLRGRGILARRGRKCAAWAWASTCVTACLIGFGVGTTLKDHGFAIRANPPGRRYVLLLTRSGAVDSLGSREEGGLVREYSAWAKRERREGHLIAGEKLNAASLELSGVGGRDEVRSQDVSLGGYFVITAPDLEAAAAIARTCPHLEHGGSVVVRPIDPTP